MRLLVLLRLLLAHWILKCTSILHPFQFPIRHETNSPQHLPLPLPPRRFPKNCLLHLQDLDRDSLPTIQERRKGRRAFQAFLRRHQEGIGPKEQVSVIGADGPAVTTGSLAQKVYDESWIAEGHINRPSARRVQSGKSGKKVKVVQE